MSRPKQEVLRWKPGDPFRREALAIIKQGRRTFEALVDVANRKLISWKEIKGVEPVLIADETEVDEHVKADPQVIAALRKRGITDLETVGCDGSSPGYFGTARRAGPPAAARDLFEGRGFSNHGGHPIEGLIVVWDSEEQKVIRVIDTGVVPVPPGNADYDRGTHSVARSSRADYRATAGPRFSTGRQPGKLAELEFPLSHRPQDRRGRDQRRL